MREGGFSRLGRGHWTVEVGAEQGEKKGRAGASRLGPGLALLRFMHVSMPVSLLPVHGLVRYSARVPTTQV